MQTVRVTNSGPFQHQLVRDFFIEAMRACKIGKPEAAIEDLSTMVVMPEMGCWVALDESGPLATMAVILPQSAFMEQPQVVLIYGRDRAATEAVVDEALKFCREAGYTTGWGINRTGSSNEALERLGHAGFVRQIGTLLEYEF